MTAKDLGTEKEAKITIESSSKLSKDEIEKLKEDAEKFSDEDKKKKEKIDLKNEAESYIYSIEKLINHDLKDKISQEQGIKITDAMKDVKEFLDKEPEELQPKLDSLKTLVNEVTTELYKNMAPPPGTDQGTGSTDQGTGSTDQGTGSTDQGTGSTDQGTGSTDQGTGSTDQGTGSTDQGTGSTDQGTGSTTDEAKNNQA